MNKGSFARHDYLMKKKNLTRRARKCPAWINQATMIRDRRGSDFCHGRSLGQRRETGVSVLYTLHFKRTMWNQWKSRWWLAAIATRPRQFWNSLGHWQRESRNLWDGRTGAGGRELFSKLCASCIALSLQFGRPIFTARLGKPRHEIETCTPCTFRAPRTRRRY